MGLLGRQLVVLLVLCALLLLMFCAPVLAHSRLLQAQPEDGATLGQAPNQVRLRFNENIEAEFSPLKVYDEQGNRVDEDDARVDPDDKRVLVADLKELTEGTYTVQWRVISADTHPVSGTYRFAVSGAGTDESQNATYGSTQAVGDSGEQTLSTDSPKPKASAQQDANAGSDHTLHIVGLGLGTLVFLALTLLHRRR